MPTFRAEVLAQRERAALGAIVLIRPLSFAVLTGATLGLGAVVIGFLATADYGRKARLTGTVVHTAGALRIDAPQAGRLGAHRVAEGAVVEAGAVLATLADPRATTDSGALGETARRWSDERREQQQRERAQTEEGFARERAQQAARLASLDAEREQLAREEDLQARREALAQKTLDRWRTLEARGVVSEASRSQHEEAWLEQRSRGEALRRARLLLDREIAHAREAASQSVAQGNARLAALDARAADAALDDAERLARAEAAVLAPTTGILAAWLVPVGQAVAAGETIASLLPEDGQLEAHFLAPSHAIGLLKPGQPVRLRYAAFPHQKHGSHPGRILSVSPLALGTRELAGTASPPGASPAYRVRVALEHQHVHVQGERVGLRPGLAVEADVEVDRRRLVEWALEPLFTVAGKV